MSLWLIGSGYMAQEHAKILLAQAIDFKVIGRSKTSAKKFENEVGQTVIAGGLTQALTDTKAPELAIIAVGVEQLCQVAKEIIIAGTKRILIEKPGGLNTSEISSLNEVAGQYNATVLMAYNRRYYESTIVAKKLIAEDGGPTSCNFEFTEWSHIIATLSKAAGVKEAWFLANSTHVVDLAFYLCGFPKQWQAWHGGSLAWHTSSSRFCGAGITEQNVFFNYFADWESPGRWSVEVLTRKRRFIFRPMEKLQVINLGSVKLESIEIDDALDLKFKPGLYKQLEAFISGDDVIFTTIKEQVKHGQIYDKIAGYTAEHDEPNEIKQLDTTH